LQKSFRKSSPSAYDDRQIEHIASSGSRISRVGGSAAVAMAAEVAAAEVEVAEVEAEVAKA